jgi:splicing factor U2AF subunit
LGRPKQYIEYNKILLSEMGTDRNLESILKRVAGMGPEELPFIEERIVCPPSKIVMLKYIVSIEELAIDEEYEEILEDVRDMAKRFGQVVNIVIPRPHQIIHLEEAPTRVKGLGLIFIEYNSVGDAKFARSQFVGKEFSGQPVACGFFDEEQFRKADFDIQEKVIIDF